MPSLNGGMENPQDKYRKLEEENLALRSENKQLRSDVSNALLKLKEQVAIEKRYEESQSRFETIFSKSLMGNKIIAPDLTIIQVNESLQQMLGYSEVDLVGTRVVDFAHPDYVNHWLDLQDNLWTKQIPSFQIETGLIKKDGSVLWCHVTSILFRDQGATLGFTILEDIRERKELELNLHKLFEAQELIQQMVAHDLKNPINNIRLLSDALKENLDNLDEHAFEEKKESITFIDMISETCERASTIVQDLLVIGSLNQNPEFENTDLNIFLHDELAHLGVNAKKKGVEIAFNPSKETIYAHINKEKFSRALENLLSNAVKFSNPGGLITLSLKQEGNKALLQISDKGIGIPENLQASIFDKFTKANRRGTKGEQTTGLGLYIVKQIVELHKGKIWIESQENMGTSFYIELE